ARSGGTGTGRCARHIVRRGQADRRGTLSQHFAQRGHVVQFWRNPEWVRYARAELRPARAATVAAVTLIVLLLFGVGSYGSRQKADQEFWHTLFIATFSVQVIM